MIQIPLQLTAQDKADFSRAEQLIIDYMRPGQWVTKGELRKLTGQEQADRRMRALRERGFTIECKRFGETRDFRYRLVR